MPSTQETDLTTGEDIPRNTDNIMQTPKESNKGFEVEGECQICGKTPVEHKDIKDHNFKDEFFSEADLTSISGPPADSNMAIIDDEPLVLPNTNQAGERAIFNENYIQDQFGVLYRPVYIGENINIDSDDILIYNNKYYTTESLGNCAFCQGAGKITVEKLGLKDCPDCDGTGDIQQAQPNGIGQPPQTSFMGGGASDGKIQEPNMQQPQITEPDIPDENIIEEEPEQDTLDSFKEKSEEAIANEKDDWITMNGVHIKVKEGQTKKQAVQDFLESKGDDLEDKDDLISNIQRAGKTHFKEDQGKAPDTLTSDKLKEWWDNKDPKEREYGGSLYLSGNKSFDDLSSSAQDAVRDRYMDQFKSRQDLHSDLKELREKHPKQPYMDEHPDIYYAEKQLRGKPTKLSWTLDSAKKTKDNTIAVSDNRDFIDEYDEIFEPKKVEGRDDAYAFGGSAVSIGQMNRIARMAKKDGHLNKGDYNTLLSKAVIDAHPNENKPVAFKLGNKTYYSAPMNLDYSGEAKLKDGYIKCSKCSQQFSNAQWLLDHMKDVHKTAGESCGCKKKAHEANIVKYKDFIGKQIEILKKKAKVGESVNVMYGLPTISKNGRKIKGKLAYAGVSLNDRIYLPEELAKGHGRKLPLLVNHSSTAGAENELDRLSDDVLEHLYNERDYKVGEVTLNWDPKQLTLFYEGVVEDKFFQKEIDDMNMAVSLGIYYDSDSPKICDENCYTLIKGAEFREVSLVYHAGFPIATIEAVEAELKEKALKAIEDHSRANSFKDPTGQGNTPEQIEDFYNGEAVAEEELDVLMPDEQPIDVEEKPTGEPLTVDINEDIPMVAEAFTTPYNFSVRGVRGFTVSNSNGVTRYKLDPTMGYETNMIHFDVTEKGAEVFGEQLQPKMTTPENVTKEIESKPDIKFTDADEDAFKKK